MASLAVQLCMCQTCCSPGASQPCKSSCVAQLQHMPIFSLVEFVCLQIREKEANLDLLIMPIDDMYALLARCALWTKVQLS